VATQKGMQDYILVLDGVNEQSIAAQGDFFHVQSVSVAAASVKLRFDDGPQITRTQGQGNRVYYSRVSVTATAACTVTLQLGFGYATDARANISANVTAVLSPALNNPAGAAVVVGAGVQALLNAADANGLEVLVGIPSTAANGLWIGDATAAVNLGVFQEPGQVIGYPTQAALYAFNAGGGGITANVLRFRDV
jgi:hypothetical protein